MKEPTDLINKHIIQIIVGLENTNQNLLSDNGRIWRLSSSIMPKQDCTANSGRNPMGSCEAGPSGSDQGSIPGKMDGRQFGGSSDGPPQRSWSIPKGV